MSTKILLEYPTSAAQQRILNDLIELVRGLGAPGQGPAISISGDDAAEVTYLKTKMAQIRETMGTYVPGADLPATQAVVSNAAAVTLLPATGTTPAQGTGTAAVASKALTGIRLAANRAVVNSGQVIAVTGGSVTLTVAANAVTAAYTPTP